MKILISTFGVRGDVQPRVERDGAVFIGDKESHAKTPGEKVFAPLRPGVT